MRLRYALSQLSRAAARRAFGRMWLWLCAGGAFVTVLAVGWRHVLFAATLWGVCVFAPVRIAVEVLHSRGPKMRRELQGTIRHRDDRYATPEHIALMIETLFTAEVHLPRLAPPDLASKIIEAAARVTQRSLAAGGPGSLRQTAATCAALVQRWTGAVATGEAGVRALAPGTTPDGGNGAAPPAADGDATAGRALWAADASIQDRWGNLRALAGLAALAQTLTAVYEDSAGATGKPNAAVRALCNAAMDYVDQVGLQLDGPAWEAIDVGGGDLVPSERVDQLLGTWTTFCAAPSPAPRRLRAFVEALTT